MRITINSRNMNPNDRLKAAIEGKFAKLGKYFHDDVKADVLCSEVKSGLCKMEATIRAGKFIFRAEESSNDIYFCLDRVVERLQKQMSRYKDKLQKKHTEQKDIIFEEIPEENVPLTAEPVGIVRVKKFTLAPMTPDEAILQMELLEHSFFVFRDGETGKTCVVYKRADEGSYGLLETE